MKVNILTLTIISLLIINIGVIAQPDITSEIDEKDTLILDLTQLERIDTLLQFPVYILTSAGTDTVNSIDFSFRYNSTELDYVDLLRLDPATDVADNVIDNKLIVSAFNFNQPVEPNKDLFKLQFDVLAGTNTIKPNRFSNFFNVFNETNITLKIRAFLCVGESVSLSADGEPGDTYLWNTGETTQTITANSPGTYVATITHSDGSTSKTQVTELVTKQLPAASIDASGPTAFCEGNSVTLSADTDPINKYLWSTGETTDQITVFDAGIYNVTVTDVFGCSSMSPDVEVTVHPLPDNSVTTSGPTEFCDGDSVQLNAADIPGYSYLWSNGDTTGSVWVMEEGNYSVTVTNEFGCTNTSDPINIEIIPLPEDTVFITGSTELCAGDTTILSAFNDPDYKYLWSTGDTTMSLTVTEPGTYFVVITNAFSCSITSSAISIEQKILSGDFDADGDVDITDFLSFASKFGQSCICPQDIDQDTNVDITDFLIFAGMFGNICEIF